MTDARGRVRAREDRYRQGRTARDRGSVSPALLRRLGEGLVPAEVACVLTRR
jgi:hypothetical protein